MNEGLIGLSLPVGPLLWHVVASTVGRMGAPGAGERLRGQSVILFDRYPLHGDRDFRHGRRGGRPNAAQPFPLLNRFPNTIMYRKKQRADGSEEHAYVNEYQ